MQWLHWDFCTSLITQQLGFLLLAAVCGATFPNFGSYTRTRWSRSLEDQKELSSALSLESVFDETAFVVGPALAGFLLSLYGSRSPLFAGIIFLVIGGIGLAHHQHRSWRL
jgi:MFS family permease